MSYRALRALTLISLLTATACTGVVPQAGVTTKREGELRSGIAPVALGAALTGIVRAPAGILSNASGGLVGDHGAGIISNNGGGLISKTKYRALALDERPLARTRVHLADASGQPISRVAPVLTDEAGRFAFKNLPRGVTFQVVAAGQAGGDQPVQLKALATAGQADGAVAVGLATTFVTTAVVSGRVGGLGALDAGTYSRAVSAVAAAIAPTDAAALTSEQAVLAAVQQLSREAPEVEQALSALREEVERLKVRIEELEAKLDQVTTPSAVPTASPAASTAPSAEASPSAAPAGPILSALAGTGAAGFANGAATAAQFNEMRGIALDKLGNLYVADRANHRIRKVTPGGTVTTFAGDGTPGFKEGAAATAQFHHPTDVAVDDAGVVYVVDITNQRVRKIADGTVSTLAGTGTRGYADGPGVAAQFRDPWGLDVANGKVYVADSYNHRIRVIDAASGVVDTYAGDGTAGYKNTNKLAAQFHLPEDVVVVRSSGTMYVSDRDNHCIRKITSGGTTTTLAGTGTAGFADGAGAVAQFNQPHGLALDPAGILYVADYLNHRVRAVVTATGDVSTLAGTGTPGYTDGPARESLLNGPLGVAVTGQQHVLVSDRHNHRLRRVTP
jgi:sugar lactone lactonase YvrE